jgi:maltodextrin utilization protein YvdJ
MNGFFNTEALEALQQAYEMQLTPDEMDIDQVTGLPTNQVSNTSPWHGTVEMWRYPDGLNKREHGQILFTQNELEEEEEKEEEYDTEYEEDTTESEMTEEEVEALIQELLSEDDDTEG